MVTKDDLRSDESTGENANASLTSGSRRGFLKRTAAVGILGLTGMAGATGSTGATETTGKLTEVPESVPTVEVTDSVELKNVTGPVHFKIRKPTGNSKSTEQASDIGTQDYRGFDKRLKIIGNSPGWTNYHIDSNGDIIKAGNCEDADWVGNDIGGGTVFGYDNWDSFYVQYGVDLITDSSGDVNYQIIDI